MPSSRHRSMSRRAARRARAGMSARGGDGRSRVPSIGIRRGRPRSSPMNAAGSAYSSPMRRPKKNAAGRPTDRGAGEHHLAPPLRRRGELAVGVTPAVRQPHHDVADVDDRAHELDSSARSGSNERVIADAIVEPSVPGAPPAGRLAVRIGRRFRRPAETSTAPRPTGARRPGSQRWRRSQRRADRPADGQPSSGHGWNDFVRTCAPSFVPRHRRGRTSGRDCADRAAVRRRVSRQARQRCAFSRHRRRRAANAGAAPTWCGSATHDSR